MKAAVKAKAKASPKVAPKPEGKGKAKAESKKKATPKGKAKAESKKKATPKGNADKDATKAKNVSETFADKAKKWKVDDPVDQDDECDAGDDDPEDGAGQVAKRLCQGAKVQEAPGHECDPRPHC